MTTRQERAIRMEYTPRPVSRTVVILFPILLTLLAGIFLPQAAPLIATLMLGNLMRESGVVDGLSRTARDTITNTATLFLGLTICSMMQGAAFLNADTAKVLLLGLVPLPSAEAVRAHGEGLFYPWSVPSAVHACDAPVKFRC